MNSTMNLIIGTMLIVVALWVWRQVWAAVSGNGWRRWAAVVGFGLLLLLATVKVAHGLQATWMSDALDRRLTMVAWMGSVVWLYFAEWQRMASPAVRLILGLIGAGLFTNAIAGEMEKSGLVWPFPGWSATVYIVGLLVSLWCVWYERIAKGAEVKS